MKAIIVKDNDFKTIGFEVTASAKTLFKWGISPSSPSYWTKEINVNDWMTEIFALVRLDAELGELLEFKRKFFELAGDSGMIEEGRGVNFEKHDEKVKREIEMIANIIKNII
jgi:hypothetical protein